MLSLGEDSILGFTRNLWRGSLLPLGCAAALKPISGSYLIDRRAGIGVAPQPNGGKPPRHNLSMPARHFLWTENQQCANATPPDSSSSTPAAAGISSLAELIAYGEWGRYRSNVV